MSGPNVGYPDIQAAAGRIRRFVHRTPVLASSSLDEELKARLFFKCENFQRVGAFKARGAHNAVLRLSDAQAAAGVATHSSGNHGAALALAARSRGIPAYVVMPDNAAEVKRRAVARYGAEIIACRPGMQAREAALAAVVARTGAHIVHPFDDPDVIAGQGTAALELFEDVPDLDLLVVPVGGGGLLSGSAIAARGQGLAVRVVGAEPAAANDAWQSFTTGERVIVDAPDTVADGLRASLGALTFPIIREHVDAIWLAEEAAVVAAMRGLWERLKVVIEASAAVTLASIQAQGDAIRGQRVGVILTGGNVDLERLPWQAAGR